MKLGGQFRLPLFCNLGRRQYREAFHLTPIDQFANDQTSFNRLADANIISNQESNWVELQGQKERHKLIGSWFNAKSGEGPEGTCTRPESQSQCITQQPT